MKYPNKMFTQVYGLSTKSRGWGVLEHITYFYAVYNGMTHDPQSLPLWSIQTYSENDALVPIFPSAVAVIIGNHNKITVA